MGIQYRADQILPPPTLSPEAGPGADLDAPPVVMALAQPTAVGLVAASPVPSSTLGGIPRRPSVVRCGGGDTAHFAIPAAELGNDLPEVYRECSRCGTLGHFARSELRANEMTVSIPVCVL